MVFLFQSTNESHPFVIGYDVLASSLAFHTYDLFKSLIRLEGVEHTIFLFHVSMFVFMHMWQKLLVCVNFTV